MSQQTAITPTRSQDFPEWYQQVIKAADMAENSEVRGCMVIKPWGYAIWELIQKDLDQRFKDTGLTNAYFPPADSDFLSGKGSGTRRRLRHGMRRGHPPQAGSAKG